MQTLWKTIGFLGLFFALTCALSAEVWIATQGDGVWSDPNNWMHGNVPGGVGDKAVISPLPDATITLDHDVTLGSLVSLSDATVCFQGKALSISQSSGFGFVTIDGTGLRSIETDAIHLASSCMFSQNNTSAPLRINAPLTGPGEFLKTGDGEIVLFSPNTLTGRITVDGGTVLLDEQGDIATGSRLTITSGVVQLAAGPKTITNLTGSGGALDVKDHALVIEQNETFSFTGNLIGTAQATIQKKGPEVLLLNGPANNFLGTLTIEEGQLLITSDLQSSLDGIAKVVIGSQGTLRIALFPQSSQSLTSEQGGHLLLEDSLLIQQQEDGIFHGRISGSGGFNKGGSSSWTLTRASEATGEWAVSEGRCILAGEGSIEQSSLLQIDEEGIFEIALGAGEKTVHHLAGAGIVQLHHNPLIVEQSSYATNFFGPITGEGGSLSKRGAHALGLGGANTFTGDFLIEEGEVITLTSEQAFSHARSLVIDSGAKLTLSHGAQLGKNVSGEGQIHLLGHKITFQQTEPTAFSGDIFGQGSLTKTGPESLTLSGNNQSIAEFLIEEGALLLVSDHSFVQTLAIRGGSCVLKAQTAHISQADVDIEQGTLHITTAAQAKQIQALSGSGGVLQLDSDFLIHQHKTATFGGQLRGQGNLTKEGTSALILTKTSPIEGLIIIRQGSLILDEAGSIEQSQGVRIEGGTFAIAQGAGLKTIQNLESLGGNIALHDNSLRILQNKECSCFGVISGTGAMFKEGGGKLTLEAHNDFTGMITITRGMIELTPGGSFSSRRDTNTKTASPALNMEGGTFFIQPQSGEKAIGSLMGTGGMIALADNALYVDQQEAHTCASVFSAVGGTLHKQGPEALTLSGASPDYLGTMQVHEGKMVMDQDFSKCAVKVENQATLEGKGTVSEVHISSGGTIRPTQTLHVAGAVTMDAEAVYAVTLRQNTSNHLSTAGPVTFDPETLIAIEPTESIIAGTTYSILTSTSAMTETGKIASAGDADFRLQIVPTNLTQTQLSAQPGSILQLIALNTLLFPQKPFTSPNGTSVVNYLRCLANSGPTPQLLSLISLLESLDPTSFNAALTQLNPALFESFTFVHLDNTALLASICTESTLARCENFTPCAKNFRIWASAFGSFTESGDVQQLPGYDTEGGGVLLGAKGLIKKKNACGIASGYFYTHLDWKRSLGKADLHQVFGSLYYQYVGHRVFLDVAAILGGSFYRTERSLSFATLQRRASAHETGFFLTPHLGLGINFYKKRSLIRLISRVEYCYVRQPERKETGAGLLNLQVKAKNSHALRTQLGLKLAHSIVCATGDLQLFVAPGWVTKIPLGSEKWCAQFRDFSSRSCQLTVDSTNKARFLFAVDGGLVYELSCFKISFVYRGEFGDHRYFVHQVSTKASWAF